MIDPRTTYFNKEYDGTGTQINRWNSYSIYHQLGHDQILSHIYRSLFNPGDGSLGRLPVSSLNYKLENGQEFEFEWAKLNINNLVKFREVEHILHSKVELSGVKVKTESQTYLSLGRNIDQDTTLRLVITGPEQIKEVFANLENLNNIEENVSVLKKQRIYSTPLSELEYLDLRCRIAIEDKDMDLVSEIDSFLRNKKSINYRLIKRQSFFFPAPVQGGSPFKIDLSVVKQGNTVDELLKNREVYEAELEFSPRTLRELPQLESSVISGLAYLIPSNYLTDLNKVMAKWDLYLNFSNDDNFTNAEKNPGFHQIREKWFNKIPNWRELNDLRDLQSTVVNFESKHLGQIYKSNSYAVTDKSDGVRNWLFINPVGDVFLIDVNMEVTLHHSRLETFGLTILDGEYVKTNEGMVFLIFDCLVINGENVMKLPLLNTDTSSTSQVKYGRLSHPQLEQLSELLNSKGILNEIKRFQVLVSNKGENEKDSFDRKKTIIDNTIRVEKPYETDGVIFSLFQPNYYQIVKGGIYYNQSNIKWKPANQLSADFLVNIQRDFNGNHVVREEEGKTYKMLDLHVRKGGDMIHYSTIIWPLSNDGQLRCMEDGKLNGNIIYDDSVIECLHGFAFSETPGISKQSDSVTGLPIETDSFIMKSEWIPIRFRPEKTQYKRPNALQTVKSIIRYSELSKPEALLISYEEYFPLVSGFAFQPQTAMVSSSRDFRGKTAITSEYKSGHYRYLLNLNQMVKFNSFRQVIDRYKRTYQQDQLNLLELAAGTANDWDNWNCLMNVYGLDIDKASVQWVQDEVGKAKNGQGIFKDHLNEAKLALEFNEIDILDWQTRRAIIDTLPMMDIITCQFALHFFTGKDEEFNQFLSLVLTKLKPNGVLLMSTFDGSKVQTLLQNDVAVGLVENELLWQITKQPSEQSETEQVFGDAIRSTIVPLTAYWTNHEYLVKLDDVDGQAGIHRLFQENGLNLLEERPFLDFINQEQIDYFRNGEHSAKRDKLERITHEIARVTEYPNLRVIADYHTVLVYSRGGNLKNPTETSLFTGLDPRSLNVRLACSKTVIPGSVAPSVTKPKVSLKRSTTGRGRGRGRG